MKLRRSEFLYFLPFFILFFDLYATTFEVGSSLRLYFFSIEFIILFTLLINKIYKKIRLLKGVGVSILIFVLYLLILVPFSTNIQLTTNYFVRIVLLFLVLINAFYYIDSFSKLLKIINLLPYLLLINYLYFVYSSITGEGEPAYKGQDFLLGYQSYASQFVFSITFISILFFYRYLKNKQKFIGVLTNIITIVILLLIFRRTNFFIIALGLIIMFVNNKYTRKNIIRIAIVLVAVASFFINDLVKITEENLSRRERITRVDNYKQEGRYIENILVYSTISNSTTTTIFGSGELFNSAGKYGLNTGDKWEYIRPIHNDYARLLFGAGFLGVILYLIIILKIYLAAKKIKPKIPELKAYFVFLLLCFLINGVSSGITDLYYRSILFLLLGGVLRLLLNEKQTLKKNILK